VCSSDLIQAYKEASVEAIAATEIIEIEPMDDLEIRFSYPQMNEVMKVIKKYPIQIVEQEVNNDCWYKLSFPQRVAAEIQVAFDKVLESF
jgi:putative IMPACT (imprinted ancient) family translation regulator